MRQYCDLHTHSDCSDGSDSPAALLGHADEVGLGAIALTDHNTAAGLPAFCAAAAAHPQLEAICGTELSVSFEGQELHLLALLLPASSFDAVNAFTDDLRARKNESIVDSAARLRAAGYAVDTRRLVPPPGKTVNRSHLAAELVRIGAVADRREAFARFLSKKGPYCTEVELPDFLTTIARVHEWGGCAVLAHPLHGILPERTEQIARRGARAGLDGMETVYYGFDAAQTAFLRRLAAELALAESGGSDYHGSVKPLAPLGGAHVPLSFLDALRQRAARYR